AVPDRGREAARVRAGARVEAPHDLGWVALADVHLALEDCHALRTDRTGQGAESRPRSPIETFDGVLLAVGDEQIAVGSDDGVERVTEAGSNAPDERAGVTVVHLHGLIALTGDQET